MNDSSQESGYLEDICPELFEPYERKVSDMSEQLNRETYDVHMWISANDHIARYYDHWIERMKENGHNLDTMIDRVESDMKDLISEQLLSSEFTSDIVRQLANSSFARIDFERLARLYVVDTVPVDFS